jgi:hypothetical protein
LYLDTDGKLYALPSSSANPNLTWTTSGNNFTGTSPGLFGTYSSNDIQIVAGGTNTGKIIGTGTAFKGCVELRNKVAIGGGTTASSGFATIEPDYTLILKSNRGSNSNYSQEGPLMCRNGSNDVVFQVMNQATISKTYLIADNGIETGDIYNNGIGGGTIGTMSNPFNTVYSIAYPAPSDARLKENIKEIDFGYEIIKKLRPVQYEYINSSKGTTFGFIAQEVDELVEDAIVVGEYTDSTYLGINYMEFIPLLVDAVQQQGRTIDSLKSSIAEIQENGQISFENKVQSSSNSKIIGLSQNHSGDCASLIFL